MYWKNIQIKNTVLLKVFLLMVLSSVNYTCLCHFNTFLCFLVLFLFLFWGPHLAAWRPYFWFCLQEFPGWGSGNRTHLYASQAPYPSISLCKWKWFEWKKKQVTKLQSHYNIVYLDMLCIGLIIQYIFTCLI